MNVLLVIQPPLPDWCKTKAVEIALTKVTPPVLEYPKEFVAVLSVYQEIKKC
jgi:hypothetical protein